MENSIIIPDNRFDFSKLRLVEPISIQGGTYFTKLYNENESLYIQTPKGTTRQGFVKSSRKIHNDLLFNKEDEQFIQWVLDLENKCIELLYNYSADWFQSPLEMADIENAFNTILKLNKTNGYVIRSNVKIHTMTKEPVIKVYNQSETPLSMEHVSKNTNIITIMEIQGIKFTSKSFQLETEIKQVMVLDKDIFDNCLIKPIIPPSVSSSLGQVKDTSINPQMVEESPFNSNDKDYPYQDMSETDSLIPEITNDSLNDESSNNQNANENVDLEDLPIQELSLDVDVEMKDRDNKNHVEFSDIPDVKQEEQPSSSLNLDITEIKDLNLEEDEELLTNSDEEENINDYSNEDSDEEEPLPKITFGEDTILSNIESIQSLGGTDETQILEKEIETEVKNDNSQNLEENSKEIAPKQPKEEEAQSLVESILDENDLQNINKDELLEYTNKDLDISDETMTLNKPDKHYYELFEKVRNEAKEAKKRAKEAYLKAKNIKKSYMLETMSESSDDSLDSLDESDEETELNLE